MAFPEVTAKLSPMMVQYIDIKKSHPDKLLMFRLGDFYELFFDDAVTASRELELVLTGRDCGLAEKAPMCGVPYHAVDSYISRLVDKGYKVVVCEQMEDPALAKGLVRRDIVRIVTPGTLTDPSLLEESANNFLCCLYLEEGGFGAAACDISTGVLCVTEGRGEGKQALNEVLRYEPREFLFNGAAERDPEVSSHLSGFSGAGSQKLADVYFDGENADRELKKLFSDDALKAFRPFKKGWGRKAAGAVLTYLRDTQFEAVSRICRLECYSCSDYMYLPESCKRNLELVQTLRSGEKRGSFLWAIDRAVTSMGRRLLKSMAEKPLLDVERINRRLDAVSELYGNSVLSGQITDSLQGVYDIERLMTRITYGKCVPRDMVSFAETSRRVSRIKALSASFRAPLLKKLASELDPFEDLRTRICETISDDPPALLKDGGYVRTGFDPEVDELRELLHNSKGYLSRLEARIKEETGIKNLRVGYNRVFGYYFEVSNSQTSLVPENFIRKQTLTTGERYVTEELKDLENRILSAGERLDRLEREIFDGLCSALSDNLQRIQRTAAAVASLDVLTSFAELARDRNYVRPEVDAGDLIRIENGRHPVVELVLKDELFVPNDTLLDCGNELVNIITGPNMSGKSTYMRQVALIVILAQMGCFVPATYAHIGVVDSVFTRVGATDDLFSGDSTFMVEMKEVAEILRDATPSSLVIMDEIGRGTSTFDGMSIARSVIEYICREGGIGCKTMFATHYHELTEMDAEYPNVTNYNIAVRKRGDEITFLRRIVEGPADDSYGIEVAKLAGIPAEVTERAREILEKLESENPDRIERRVVTTVSEQADALTEELRGLHIETMTPIEAMSTLDRLIKAARKK